MKTIRTLSCFALLLGLPFAGRSEAQTAAAAPVSPAAQAELAARPRIGLVLSGGGARGAAHVGVLKVLEELRVPIDAIAGTSMGSIVGGLYCAGLSPEELTTALSGLDWSAALSDSTGRDLLSYRRKQDDLTLAVKIRVGLRGWTPSLPLGLIQGQKLEFLLRSFVLPAATVTDFDDLVVPFRAVAADLGTTHAVVIGEGDLVQAMRASMSVPGLFSPVEYAGRMLIDGGVADNLPVDVIRTMNVDVVIAVDIGAHLTTLEKMNSAYSVNDQMLTGLMRRETTRQMESLGPDDIGLIPDLGDYGSGDFAKAGEIIPLGEKAARESADRFRRYSLSEEAWRAHRAGLRSFPSIPPRITKVELVENSDLSAEYVQSLVTVEPGKSLDLAQLEKDIQRIYGLDMFEKVSYQIGFGGPQGDNLRIDARKRSWGPDYVQFGLALRDNLEGKSAFDFLFRLNKLAVSETGAEWRTDLRIGERQLLQSEYYQPFGGVRGLFVAPRITLRREPILLLDRQAGESHIYRLGTYGGAFDVGHAFDNWGELRLGIERFAGNAESVASGLPSFDYDEGRVYAVLGIDTYDNASFPREGLLARAELSYSAESLGATDDLGRARLGINKPLTWGMHTITFGMEAAGFFDDTKIAEPYQLGGFGRLSGLGEGRLIGRYTAIARAVYSMELKRIMLSAIKMPVYVGGTVEVGNAWMTKDEVKEGELQVHTGLYIGVDSPLGPVYLGGGWGEQNEKAFYFFLGRTF